MSQAAREPRGSTRSVSFRHARVREKAATTQIQPIDLRQPGESWMRRRANGKELRERTPREIHAGWKPAKDRPDPLELIEQSNVGRQKELIPLRMGRMAQSPFAFLRGAAPVMDWDLARVPSSGVDVVICGDAHLSNFGFYGTPQRDVVFDLNDFDEAATDHGSGI
jgi:hypothetical protein